MTPPEGTRAPGAAPPGQRIWSDRFVPLQAKVCAPLVRSPMVPREALMERLFEARYKPVVVVAAPAGYGKTTTVVQWSRLERRPFAWLTLDEMDNDPVRLLRYLTFSIHQAVPLTDELMHLASRPDAEVDLIVPLLCAELTQAEPAVLVLDDVHVLSSPVALRCVRLLTTELPRPGQLVLAGRAAPAVGLSRSRIRDDLVELYAPDLTMSEREAGAMLVAAGVAMTRDDVSAIVQRTEGWPAALSLAAQSARRGDGGMATIGRLCDPLLADYLHEEVIAQIEDEDLDFLRATSVLAFLSAPLCDAVLSGTRSAARLEELARPEHRFLIPLDPEGTWYRHHHLLAELFGSQLGAAEPERKLTLHRRASRWCEAHHELSEAIRHAAEAGDLDRAGTIILRHVLAFVSRGDVATVGRWLDRFEAADLTAHPPLAIARSVCELARGDLQAAGRWVALAEAGAAQPTDDPVGLQAAVATVRALLGAGDLAEMANDAARVESLGPGGSVWYPLACQLRGSALVLMGHDAEAWARLTEAERVSRGVPAVHAASLAQLAMLSTAHDDGDAALQLVRRAVAEMDAHGLGRYRPLMPLHALAALTETTAGDPAAGARAAGTALELLHATVGAPDMMSAQVLLLLAETRQRLGDIEGARAQAATLDALLAHQPRANALTERAERLRRAVETDGTGLLTTAERRVLALLPTHLSMREISEHLYLSRNTVKSQAIAVYRKLGVSARSPAVERARELGLLNE